MRTLLASLALCLLALLLGVVTGFAGRIVQVAGLYDVVAALALSVTAVALHHLLRARPGAARFTVAALAALIWLAGQQVTDAWAFRQEQGQAVLQHTDMLAQDFVLSGAETPLQLVDAGLQADTGAPGLRGALLVQAKAGLVVHRAMGVQRVLPLPRWGFALALACEVAFVTLVVTRALAVLAGEPTCPTCQRFLRRRLLGTVDGAEVAKLAQAWAHGERTAPTVAKGGGVALVYEDACPHGHTQQPGYVAVRMRRRALSPMVPGPIAELPPV